MRGQDYSTALLIDGSSAETLITQFKTGRRVCVNTGEMFKTGETLLTTFKFWRLSDMSAINLGGLLSPLLFSTLKQKPDTSLFAGHATERVFKNAAAKLYLVPAGHQHRKGYVFIGMHLMPISTKCRQIFCFFPFSFLLPSSP